jgi:hypothetical protein
MMKRRIAMSKYNEKQKEYTMNYMKENLDEIKFRVPKGKKEEYRKIAESRDMKLTPFIIDGIEEKISRQENNISECFMDGGISLTTLDNMLYGAYMDKNPRDPYERESHYADRISNGYAEIKKEIAKYFSWQ